ncbi:MAG: hypothetical protein ACKOEO_21210, partial [Planctomycetaceae bacterium]
MVHFQSTFGGNSGIQAAADSNLRFDGDVTLGDGNTGSLLPGIVQLDGLTFSGFDEITFGTTTLSGAAVSVNSNNSPIAFTGTVNGAQNLSLTAGSGNIDFDAAIGALSRLGTLTIVSAANVTADSSIEVAAVSQQAGTGTTTFTDSVNTNAAAGVSLTTANVVLNNGLTTTNGGPLSANLTGTFSMTGSTTNSVAGAASVTAAGAITVGASASLTSPAEILLKSTGNSILLQSAVTVTSSNANVVLEAEDSISLNSDGVVTATTGELILRSGLDSTDGTGGMVLDGTLQALAAGQTITLDLNDEQGATQNSGTGAILATNLRLISNTQTTASFSLLAESRNDVDVLAASTSGAVTFRDLDDLTIGSITGTSGIPDMSGISTVNSASEGAAVSVVVTGALVANQP